MNAPEDSVFLCPVLLVEDHPVIRSGVRLLLENTSEFKVIAETGKSREVLNLAEQFRPEIVLLDLVLDWADGLELIRELVAALPACRVLVFSMLSESVYAERALRAGAVGYIMKSAPEGEFLLALRNVRDGRVYLSPRIFIGVFRGAMARGGAIGGVAGLSDRELHIFQLIGAGVRNREIASALGISVKTVESHRENIKSKLNLHDGAELGLAALRFVESLRGGHGGSP